jgi:hypothetical protein
MTKILNSYLRFVRAALGAGFAGLLVLLHSSSASSGLVLSHYGPVSELVASQNPWNGFNSQGAVLTVLRVQRVGAGDCARWSEALINDVPGTKIVNAKSDSDWNQSWQGWSPWNEDDLKAVSSCDELPCAVKLDGDEVSHLAEQKKENRFKAYLNEVMTRSRKYEKTQIRKEYEFPGNPVDPWSLFRERGLVASSGRPLKSSFWVRRLDFGSGDLRIIRQVLDRRVARSKTGVTVWLRDAYTDHYFDGWGEWTQIACDPAPGKGLTLVQALALELDLLKKNDLVSKLMRGKMKSAIQDNGTAYLTKAFGRIRDAALTR